MAEISEMSARGCENLVLNWLRIAGVPFALPNNGAQYFNIITTASNLGYSTTPSLLFFPIFIPNQFHGAPLNEY